MRQTLAALAAVGAKVYGTDKNGTITVTTDGKAYTVRTTRTAAPRAPPPAAPVKPPASSGAAASPISVVSLTSPIARGSTARLSIRTTPGASCTITVYYKSGPSQAAGLGPETVDENGIASWQWKVGPRTTPGTWRIVVTASGAGQTLSKEIPFGGLLEGTGGYPLAEGAQIGDGIEDGGVTSEGEPASLFSQFHAVEARVPALDDGFHLEPPGLGA